MQKQVEIYTDGACSGNPGPGGWAAILNYNGQEKILTGGEPETTNNRMELLSAIEALQALKTPCTVELYSDSAYLIDAMTKGWLTKWVHNNWRTSGKEAVKNQDLWQELLKLIEVHQVNWRKVRGHTDNVNNNRCDALARQEISKLRQAQGS